MAASVFKINRTGTAGAIAVSHTVPAGEVHQLVSVSCKMSAAPTTSENFTVKLDANAGSAYDLELNSIDLSAASTTDHIYYPDGYGLLLEGGDAIDVAYANTDVGTFGVQITVRKV
jgi:hypothetical protein